MATSTQDIHQKHSDGVKRLFKVGVDIIYGGCFVGTDNTSSGYLFDLDAPAADEKFAGVACYGVDNSGGSAGDKSVEVWTEGCFEFSGTGFSQATVGQPVYLLTNCEVTTTPGQYGVYVGKCIRYISSTKIEVKIDTNADRPASAVVNAGGTAPLQQIVGNTSFTTTATTKLISVSPLSAVTAAWAHITASPKANERISFISLTVLTSNTSITFTRATTSGTLTATSGLTFAYGIYGY